MRCPYLSAHVFDLFIKAFHCVLLVSVSHTLPLISLRSGAGQLAWLWIRRCLSGRARPTLPLGGIPLSHSELGHAEKVLLAWVIPPSGRSLTPFSAVWSRVVGLHSARTGLLAFLPSGHSKGPPLTRGDRSCVRGENRGYSLPRHRHSHIGTSLRARQVGCVTD